MSLAETRPADSTAIEFLEVTTKILLHKLALLHNILYNKKSAAMSLPRAVIAGKNVYHNYEKIKGASKYSERV